MRLLAILIPTILPFSEYKSERIRERPLSSQRHKARLRRLASQPAQVRAALAGFLCGNGSRTRPGGAQWQDIHDYGDFDVTVASFRLRGDSPVPLAARLFDLHELTNFPRSSWHRNHRQCAPSLTVIWTPAVTANSGTTPSRSGL